MDSCLPPQGAALSCQDTSRRPYPFVSTGQDVLCFKADQFKAFLETCESGK